MAGRVARIFELAKASWSVVKADKELLLLPVMSVAALIVILGSLAVPVAVLGGFTSGAASGDTVQRHISSSGSAHGSSRIRPS